MELLSTFAFSLSTRAAKRTSFFLGTLGFAGLHGNWLIQLASFRLPTLSFLLAKRSVFRYVSEHLHLSVKVLVDKFDARSFQLFTFTFQLAQRSVFHQPSTGFSTEL